MQFSDREQRNHVDIEPGMMFFFMRNPNRRAQDDGPLYTDPDDEEFDHSVPWIVIGKEYVTKLSGGYWRYLLLGPGPTLKWNEGQLGWIRRVADPLWDDRERNGYCARLDQSRSSRA